MNRDLLGAGQQSYDARDVLQDAERMDGVWSETWIVSVQSDSTLRLHTPTLRETPIITPEVLGRTTALMRWLELCVWRLHSRYRREGVTPVAGSFVLTVNDNLWVKDGQQARQVLLKVGAGDAHVSPSDVRFPALSAVRACSDYVFLLLGQERRHKVQAFVSPVAIASSTVEPAVQRVTISSVVPFPDAQFLMSHGHRLLRGKMSRIRVHKSEVERNPRACWRGVSTGFPLMGNTNWKSNQRVQLANLSVALAARGERWLDARLSKVVQASVEREAQAYAAGIMGDPISSDILASCSFMVDVDGNANAWEGFFWKLMSGSPVFKVQSAHGFSQWYYERLQPWVHYIPVQPDLSDFAVNFR